MLLVCLYLFFNTTGYKKLTVVSVPTYQTTRSYIADTVVLVDTAPRLLK